MSLLPGNKSVDAELTAQETGNPLFPVFLKLNQLHTVLIGGGNVGLEKLAAMLGNSPLAAVTIISREFIDELIQLIAGNPRISISIKKLLKKVTWMGQTWL